ncbi:MAG: CHAT domain-containing protein, partial [Pseudonocardia sp.]
MRDHLVDSVYRRVESFTAGETEAVLAPEALAEADQLLGYAGTSDGPDLQVLHAAGMLHLSRWTVLGEEAGASPRLAATLLRPVYLSDESSVSSEIAEALAAERHPPEAGAAGRAYDLGVAVDAVAAVTNDATIAAKAVELLRDAVLASADYDDPWHLEYLATFGSVLRIRYERHGDPADLHDAIDALRDCVAASAPSDTFLAGALAELGMAWQLTFERTHDPRSMTNAVRVARRALAVCRPDLPARVAVLTAVNGVLVTAQALRPEPALVHTAVETARECLARTEPGDPQRPIRMVLLAFALHQLSRLTGDPEVTAEATELGRSAVTAVHTGDPQRPLMAMKFGSLLLGYGDGIDTNTLDEAIAAFESAVQDLPQDHFQYPRCQAGLGIALHLRWDRDGDPAALDRAIGALRAAVAGAPERHPDVPTWLAGIADSLGARGARRRSTDDADEAIAICRHLISAPGDGRADRMIDLAATALRLRFELTGDESTIVELVERVRETLRSEELDEESARHLRSILGMALTDLAQHTTDDDHLREGLAVLRDLAADPAQSADAAAVNSFNLSQLLYRQYERTGEGLPDAIRAARQAVDQDVGTPHKRIEPLIHLAALLCLNGALDEALSLGRRAVDDCPSDHPRTMMVLSAFADILRQRFLRFGNVAELDEAIELLRKVTTHTGRDRSSDALALSRLAATLRARHDRWPDLATLEQALDAARRAIRELPATHPERTKAQANLVVPLLQHYRRRGDAGTLAEAIDTGRQAVAATPRSHRGLGTRLANLATALSAEFRRTGRLDVLEEAIAADRRAVAVTAPGDPDRNWFLNNLSAVLIEHHEHTGEPDSVAEAVTAAREAVASTPTDHPSRAIRLLNLAATLGLAAERGDGVGGALEAMVVAEAAAGVANAMPSARLGACRIRGRLAAVTQQWDAAAEAFGQGVALLPQVVPRNLRRADAEHQLAGIDDVHVNAAASALCAGDPGGALAVLEQGRGVLASYALDTRGEFAAVSDVAPDLATEAQRLIDELDRVDTTAIDEDPIPSTEDRRGLDARWHALISEIRTLPGFSRFLVPPSVDELLPAGAAGAVVTVNVSELRCDALVLSSGRIQVVPLPALTVDELAVRVPAFLRALDTEPDGAALAETLGWLWDVLGQPVLDALGHRATPQDGESWPRVWWSPTGLLNFLPLHAAGRPERSGAAVLDRAVSSYTPTIRALLHARSRPMTGNPRLLAVALSQTPGQAPLPATRIEAEALVRHFTDPTTLLGADATAARVLAALPTASWVHFACHAYSDPVNPSRSHLVLHDRPMTVTEISRLRLVSAELAYLSACSTARSDERLA